MGCFRECFAQLLHNPSCSRMSGNVEVQDAAPSVLDDEEAVEQAERQRRHGEEVDGGGHLAMILEKGQPLPAWIATAANPSHISGDSPFRDFEAELE